MADISKTVQIIFAAEDKTSATLDTLQKEGQQTFDAIEGSAAESSGKIKSTWDSLKEHWVGVTVAIGAAWITVSKAWDLAEQAAQFEEQKAALDLLASQYGTTADAIIESIKKASDGQVSLVEAVNIASNALLKGLNPTQLEQFMEIAVVVSNATGKSVAESFEGIATAVANGQERLLKTQGIVVDLNGAWTKWAEANGRTVDSLSEVEKQVISADAVIAAMADKVKALGEAGESTDDKMAQFTAMMADLKLAFGEILIKAVAGTVSALFGFSAVFNEVAGIVLTGIATILDGFAKLPGIGGMFESLSEEVKGWAEQSFMAAEDAAKKSETAYNTIFSSAEKASGGVKTVTKAQDDGKISAEEYAEAIKKYGDAFTVIDGKIVPMVVSTKEAADALKKLDDEIFGAKKEQVDDWTKLAMEYNAKEVELRKDGVTDMSKLDEWYYAKSAVLQGKDLEAAKKAAEEKKKDTEKSIDQLVKYKLGLEEIQSKERVSIFEIQTKVDTAKIEAASKAFETMFNSINTGMTSTENALGDLFSALSGTTANTEAFDLIKEGIEKEQKLRQQEFDLQKGLIEKQIEYMALKATAMKKGDALINISADGLEPEFEAFMWQILKRIQVRANAEGAEYLLGI